MIKLKFNKFNVDWFQTYHQYMAALKKGTVCYPVYIDGLIFESHEDLEKNMYDRLSDRDPAGGYGLKSHE